MIIDIDEEEFLRYSMKIKFLIVDFIARATSELASNDFSDLDYKITTKNYYVVICLLYGDDDPTILSWQIYLQELVNHLATELKIDFESEVYDGVLIIIEHRNLWTSKEEK